MYEKEMKNLSQSQLAKALPCLSYDLACDFCERTREDAEIYGKEMFLRFYQDVVDRSPIAYDSKYFISIGEKFSKWFVLGVALSEFDKMLLSPLSDGSVGGSFGSFAFNVLRVSEFFELYLKSLNVWFEKDPEVAIHFFSQLENLVKTWKYTPEK